MPVRPRPTVLLITPYLADANNGNWRTAHRWQQLLQPEYRVIIANEFVSDATQPPPDICIALHARRSHDSVAALRRARTPTPIVVALTGTDLYSDLADSTAANASLDLADALIVLQEDAIGYVPSHHRRKTHVVFQSAPTLTPAAKSANALNCVVVGHLRAEKLPETIFAAVALLAGSPSRQPSPIHITHIGAALDPSLGKLAESLTQTHSLYRWVNALPHGLTRAAIKRAHLLIHPSKLEGGANVIVEAVTAGTPVLASQMSGNIGMLGQRYEGYFPVGDANALVALLQRCQKDANFLARLNTSCKARAALFKPSEEKRRLIAIVRSILPESER
jgi:putative glycosyltransferase (TIGR04348 family)